MFLVTKLRLLLDETTEIPLPGVKVALFDRDEADPDDHLASDFTNEHGEILFKFDSSRYTDEEDSPSWRLDSLPDLYVVIYDAYDQVIYGTRSVYMKDKLPKEFTIRLHRDLAEQHGLLD